jgi:hypothetical protein
MESSWAPFLLAGFGWLLLAGGEAAETRPVAVSRESTAMRERLQSVEDAVNDENLDAYAECFIPRVRKPLRRRVAMLFVRHEMAMEILDSHVLSSSETGGEIAVKYRAVLSGRASEVVAVLGMTKEDGVWRISKETIHSAQVVSSGVTADCGSACGMRSFQLGGGQVCGAVPRNWDPYNPPADLIDPALEHLRGDIGILPGRGCSSGRCGQPPATCR